MKTLLTLFAVVLLAGCFQLSNYNFWTYVPPEARQVFVDHFGCPNTDTYCGTIEIVASATPDEVGYVPLRHGVPTVTHLVIIDADGYFVWIPVHDVPDPVTGDHTGLFANPLDEAFWLAQGISIDYLTDDFPAGKRTLCKAEIPVDWDQPWPAGIWTATGVKLNATCTVKP